MEATSLIQRLRLIYRHFSLTHSQNQKGLAWKVLKTQPAFVLRISSISWFSFSSHLFRYIKKRSMEICVCVCDGKRDKTSSMLKKERKKEISYKKPNINNKRKVIKFGEWKSIPRICVCVYWRMETSSRNFYSPITIIRNLIWWDVQVCEWCVWWNDENEIIFPQLCLFLLLLLLLLLLVCLYSMCKGISCGKMNVEP